MKDIIIKSCCRNNRSITNKICRIKLPTIISLIKILFNLKPVENDNPKRSLQDNDDNSSEVYNDNTVDEKTSD